MHVVVEPGIRNSNRNVFCRGIADADQLFWKEYLELVRLFVEGQKEKINRENSIFKNVYQVVSVIYFTFDIAG